MVFVLRDRERIAAGLERCFALSTSVPVVRRTLGFEPVAGVTQGQVRMDSEVLWRGRLFGLRHTHLTKITAYAAPHTDEGGNRVAWFQDTQARGRFAVFQHNHHLLEAGGETLLQDEIRYALPLGWLGALVGRFVMLPYIRRTLRARMRLLRRLAESREGDGYVYFA